MTNTLAIHAFLLAFISGVTSAMLSPCTGYTFTIVIKDGMKRPRCYEYNHNTIYCPSLHDALAYHDLNGKCILLAEKNTPYVIDSLVSLRYVKRFALKASSSNQTIECANSMIGCGIHFNRSVDIAIANLIFNSSAAAPVMNVSTPTTTITVSSLLTFYQCDNVNLSRVNFHNITGHSVVAVDSSIAASTVTVERGVSSGFIIILKERNLLTMNLSFVIFQDIRVENKSEPYKSMYNSTSPAGKGAGISIFFMEQVAMNTITCYQCVFQRNTATYGTGIFVFMAHGTFNNTLLVDETNFDSNIAWASGGGMYISSSQSKSNTVHIVDSIFRNNSADPVSGGGALFAYNCHVTMSGRVTIVENTGTAMVVGATVLEVRSGANINVTGNSGPFGGAMFLFKAPAINVHNSSNVLFSGNWAGVDGGALFVFHEFEKKATKCFFDPQYRLVLIVFFFLK